MKQWFKKISGIEAREQELAEEKARIEKEELDLLLKKDPKEFATRKGEPWVNVLDVQINEENIRNGFFELDWNDLFIEQLISAGYGFENDPPEEIVDRWFKDIIFNILSEDGLDTNRNAGYINVTPISKGKSEVS